MTASQKSGFAKNKSGVAAAPDAPQPLPRGKADVKIARHLTKR
jgi:hypothetical protein